MFFRVKGFLKVKAATNMILVFIVLCLASITLVRCQPVERNIEIDCKWKGAPVSANLKWTEPKEDPVAISNTNDGSESNSGTTNSQPSTAINTQQALMLTGASAGAALAGGGLLVKKKLEGSSSSEQKAKQTTSTSTTISTSSTPPEYTSDIVRSYREGLEPSVQTQQSSIQNPPKDGGLTPTASTLTASAATITKDLLMQKQMASLHQAPKQSQPDVQKPEPDVATSTLTSSSASAATVTKELLMQKQMDSLTKQSTQESGKLQQQKSKQETASLPPTTSQGIGLLASSSSAAQIAAEMWPQRQNEFEKLAKQRADLAARFSIPSYSTGLTSSLTNTTGNAWAKLQGFGSAISNGLSNTWATIKPYAPAILLTVIILTAVYGGFVFGLFSAGMTGAGMASVGTAGAGISLGGGAGLVGAGIAVGLGTYTAYNLGIMNYPQQSSFAKEHTQIIEQEQTLEIKDEKGSGPYGEDVAQDQLEQAEIRKDSVLQGEKHDESKEQVIEWLNEQDEPIIRQNKYEPDPERPGKYQKYGGRPDIITKHYIVECKVGEDYEVIDADIQKHRYIELAEREGKRLLYWFLKRPAPESKWWKIIHELEECGWLVEYGDG